MTEQLRLPVTDPSHVSAARQEGAALTGRIGLDQATAARLALVLTEIATNQVHHTRAGGEILLRRLSAGEGGGVEILGLDSGPGMRNLAESLRDGHSTRGGPGTGLGAISRLSDDFDAWTAPGRGTVLVARLRPRGPGNTRAPRPPGACLVGAVSVPAPGETACGDAWEVSEQPGRITALVVDGLGHGPLAADAAQMALRVFRSAPPCQPVNLLERVHGGLRATRGAAASVACLDLAAGVVQFAGVGNVGATLIGAGTHRGMTPRNGTLGAQAPTISEFQYAWNPDSTLIMFSDGLKSQWSLEAYPGLLARHPALVAAVLYRDYSRGWDDATVLVIRQNRP